MADSTSRSADSRSPLHASKNSKVIRAQRIVPTSSIGNGQHVVDPETSDGSIERSPLPRSHTPGHLSAKSGSGSHEAGAAAAAAARRVPSDLSVRQRSQSATVAGASPRTSSARPGTSSNSHGGGGSSKSKPRRGATVNGYQQLDNEYDGGSGGVDEKLASYGRRTVAATRSTSTTAGGGGGGGHASTSSSGWLASTSAPGASSTAVATTTSRTPTSTSQPPRGQHTAFPPLQKPGDAPDVPQAPASGMYWSRAPTSGVPVPCLRAHATAAIGSSIYVFGGCDARACFNDLYVLDADTFHWSRPHVVGEVPTPLRAMTCTAVGRRLVMFGGGDGPAYYNDVHVLDTANFRWTRPRIVGDRVPPKRRAHTACLYRSGIYVFGGGDGVRALNDVWRLDVSDMTKMSWKLVSAPDTPAAAAAAVGTPASRRLKPRARGYHTANMVGSKLIIYGGSDGAECFDDVWVYDVDDHTWRHVDVPDRYGRLSHTATIVGSYLFVVGGHDGKDYVDDILLLNLVTMTWDRRKAYGRPPSGRGYHSALLYDSRLVIIGGFDGTDVFRDVMILELAVHAYYSQISHFTIEV
ncbi:Kelch motif [Geosmithia morbida]|uniref:Kelch motif n=1 Tax=Geosmithia morbida TaxID=1094350 RepID=A0A9P4Z0M1_9HYPO|nr:Kelch motif [Geosmithia morbida]KAF4125098.1 Kelch motif [Geosmithia morbida]